MVSAVHEKLYEVKGQCDFIQEMALVENLFMGEPLMVNFVFVYVILLRFKLSFQTRTFR